MEMHFDLHPSAMRARRDSPANTNPTMAKIMARLAKVKKNNTWSPWHDTNIHSCFEPSTY